MNNWVVLFVRTGVEYKLVNILKGKLNHDEYLPFLPLKEKARRDKGVITKERRLLFLGYVFIQTTPAADLIAEKLELILKHNLGHKDIYGLLHYGDNNENVALHENERLYWEGLLDDNFCAKGSIGFIKGDLICVTSGALVGMESKIKRIDRHKREAVVEFEMMGALREVRLMLEIVEKKNRS